MTVTEIEVCEKNPLPGKYAVSYHIADAELTVTFQTLAEMKEYLKEQGYVNAPPKE